MEPAVFAMVLTAAALHAAWNILLKTAADSDTAMATMTVVFSGFGFAMVARFGAPPPELWPFLAATAALHAGYNLSLVRAYRLGDFSRAYPISRGTAPLLAAVWALLFLDEQLQATQWIGMGLAAVGVASLSFQKTESGGQFFKKGGAGGSVFAALVVAVFVASYSAVDAAGVRVADDSGSPFVYIAWAFALEGVLYLPLAWRRRGRLLFCAPRETYAKGIAGGLLAFAAYALALLAYAKAPVGMVAAVREVSVLLGAFYGAVVLREGFVLRRTVSAGVVAGGLGLLLVS